jgi:hypothetical protein
MTRTHFRRLAGFAAAIGLTGLGGCVIMGHQIVQNRELIPGGATKTVLVSCPAGKKVLGGGFSTETPDDIKLYSSDPSDGQGNLSAVTWSVMVKNTGTQARQTTAIAICADAK